MGYRPRAKPRSRPPLPPGISPFREHSAHGADSDFEEVRLLDGTLVALLCTCGAQLPPVLCRDPDGWIVDSSWR